MRGSSWQNGRILDDCMNRKSHGWKSINNHCAFRNIVVQCAHPLWTVFYEDGAVLLVILIRKKNFLRNVDIRRKCDMNYLNVSLICTAQFFTDKSLTTSCTTNNFLILFWYCMSTEQSIIPGQMTIFWKPYWRVEHVLPTRHMASLMTNI